MARTLGRWLKALDTVKRHLQRWTPAHKNGRVKSLNGRFQTAGAGARGQRNTSGFFTRGHGFAAPLGDIFKSS